MANSKNIWAATLAASGGSFYRAELGTPLPEDALEELDAGFADHGWMGDDGFKFAPKRDVTKHKAFGGETVKVTQDNYECTVKVTIYEQNIDTLKTIFGDDNVEVSFDSGHAQYRIDWDDDMLPRSSFVVRFIDGEKTGLHVIEEGQVIEIDEIEYVHDQIAKFTLTIECFKPASGNPGVYTLLDDPDNTDS
jgi:hypothetical protein